jgi:4-amino-4-deoxy-L-arabinose transferase-like glycosyltransferase
MGDLGRRSVARFLVLPLLLILFAVLSFGARRLSFTFDEPSHITSGYTFLARGREATWTVPLRGHPLLADGWLALPFYVGNPTIPVETLDGWGEDYRQYVEAFAPFLTEEMARSEFAVRVPAMLLAVLLAAVVYRWCVDLWGEWVGLVALGMLVFDPTLLAHGRLATNDVAVTAIGTLGLFLVWRWAQVFAWRRAAVAGVVLGIVMLTKVSGLLWVAIGLAWAAWAGLRRWANWPSAWLQVLFVAGIAFFLLWGAYGFTVGTIPRGLPFSIPLPAPQHWTGVIHHAAPVHEHTVIALGKVQIVPWVWYFPVAFLIKNPLPFLVALLFAVGALSCERRGWGKLSILGLFSALYVAVALNRGPNIGYRHMLPIQPLLYLLVAGGAAWAWRRWRRVGRWVVVALGVWTVVGALGTYPYELSFFNELAGGSKNGWRYLTDSNSDWGQGWLALRAFQEERAVTFSYSGPEGYARITPYDLWDESLPPLHRVSRELPSPWLFPEPGDYVLSANSLSGVWLVDHDNFSWFRHRVPDAVIADIFYYYHVDSTLAPAWVAQCAVPAVPLDEGALARGFEGVDVRFTAFDCSQSWVYPGGGAARGAYALHGAILQPETLRERLHLAAARPVDLFVARHLADAPQIYRQWNYGTVPAFALYEMEGPSVSVPSSSRVGVAPVDAVPGALAGSGFQATPLPLDGPMDFLGVATYSFDSSEQMLEVETWWRATEGPLVRSFSIMAHLLTADGTVVGVADGLGAFPPVLAAGDVVVQRHRFPMPTEDTGIYLRTGAYWMDTMERWPVQGMPGDNVLIVPLEWE